MSFFVGRGFAALQILKKWKCPYLLNWVEYCDEILHTHWQDVVLTRCGPWDCQMSFGIGRGFAEVQNLKKWKWPYLLNWVEYFDKLLRKHWYWQDLAQEIANWHFYRSRLCRAPNSEKVKMALNCEEYSDEVLHTYWYWQDVANEIVQWHLGLVEVLPRFKFWKKNENGPIFEPLGIFS